MIIGIGGVSRAGKTTLANQLSKRIKGKTIGILKQDDFVKKDHLPMIRDHIDWEHPDSIDWKSLLSAIQSYKKKYDLVIVEGLFAFYQGNINACYDRCIFVYIEKDLFWKRKKQDLRWGREPNWFVHHIWESYVEYGALPKNKNPVFMVNGAHPAPINQVIDLLQL
ncbi:MAG: hypothetical protein KA109_01905 [Saprospiraceae bacterium]|jgi:uridine kinase|nr:hypothetical protein [Saprospiraceae bacterium]MBK6477830.1 hypothetical protein [Saprospiraceae bacterium]MBK6816294.1 hypothetical protein [Saprospiraceae bacterium]MBK7438116.1 hypothetical protein [Saprospiraceae bacterium]MBK8280646.1 hypothetical protein [Saprospiraceae bacterium]